MPFKVIPQRRRSRPAPPARPAPAPAPVRQTIPAAPAGPVVLSVLVPTVPDREAKLARLLATLEPQIKGRLDVELLVLRDCRGMTIGEKRTRMISIARGDYVSFVDDDDAVATDYVSTIVAHLTQRPDVLCFEVTVNGHGPSRPCYYGLTLTDKNLPNCYHRKPNHLMVWRRELAASVPFPAIRSGEDTAWANLVCARAEREVRIPRVLYTYDYDPSDNSMTPR